MSFKPILIRTRYGNLSFSQRESIIAFLGATKPFGPVAAMATRASAMCLHPQWAHKKLGVRSLGESIDNIPQYFIYERLADIAGNNYDLAHPYYFRGTMFAPLPKGKYKPDIECLIENGKLCARFFTDAEDSYSEPLNNLWNF